eukprot:Nitzschia sp. Nitz4//scaffold78_size91513//77999//79602//NITZ4_004938-RA/size91513-snap-gene-0.129-mRNA-1//1//CDS//3329558157//3362//frame0
MPTSTMEETYGHPEMGFHGGPIRCAGCHTAGVPLLACDDIDSTGAANPSLRARFCANCMIGKKVRVFWPVDSSWYVGTVQRYDANTGEHLLRYDDDDTEWVKIGESNTTAPPNSHAPPGRTASPHESSMLEPIPPVSPAAPMMDPESSPSGAHNSHHAYSMDHPQQPSVTPDNRDRTPTSRRGPPPPYHTYPGTPSAMYPPMGYHQPYPGYHPGPYAYTPQRMYPPMASPDAANDPPRQSPSPTNSGGKRKNGPKAWTKEEDSLLLSIVQSMHMPMKWSLVAQSLPGRTGKQCRERYVNHLNPRLKVTDWSPLEDATIFHLYNTIGSHWAKMSKMIPGRTDNGIKNRFHNLRRQLEREDEHRLRLSSARDFPEEIRLERIREVPEELRGKTAQLWEMKSGLSVLAAQSVLGGNMSRSAGRFGPFRTAEDGDVCVRCGFMVPSVQTGTEVCTKTGWCQSCTRLPPHVSGSMLRECLNLRRSQEPEMRKIIESWEEPNPTPIEESKA